MGDFLDKIVTEHLIKYLRHMPETTGNRTPELAQILPYFPLDPIKNGVIDKAAWPLIDGQLTTTPPCRITSNSFSGAYAHFLSRLVLQKGTGTAQRYLNLAKLQSTSLKNINLATAENGGGNLRNQLAINPQTSFVPNYAVKWSGPVAKNPLSILIDVWRPRHGARWRPVSVRPWGNALSGHPRGQRLRATLTYSDVRIATINPLKLINDTGWYSKDLVAGLKYGSLGGVQFIRRDNPGEVDHFVQTFAFVVAGRLQCDIDERTSFNSGLLAAQAAPTSKGTDLLQAQTNRLQLTDHLHVPLPADPVPQGFNSAQSSFDSGDLFTTLNAGLVFGAIKDLPLIDESQRS